MCRTTYLSPCLKRSWTDVQESSSRSTTPTHTCSTWQERSTHRHTRLGCTSCCWDFTIHLLLAFQLGCWCTQTFYVTDPQVPKYATTQCVTKLMCPYNVWSRVTGTSGTTSWAERNRTSASCRRSGLCCHRKDSVRSTHTLRIVWICLCLDALLLHSPLNLHLPWKYQRQPPVPWSAAGLSPNALKWVSVTSLFYWMF